MADNDTPEREAYTPDRDALPQLPPRSAAEAEAAGELCGESFSDWLEKIPPMKYVGFIKPGPQGYLPDAHSWDPSPQIGFRKYTMFSQVTISALQAENIRAQAQHGFERTNLSPDLPIADKMYNIGEEFGELNRMLTYDNDPRKDGVNRTPEEFAEAIERWYISFVKEAIQLANLALALAQQQDLERVQVRALALGKEKS